MSILREFCDDQKCTREDHFLLHLLDDKFKKSPKNFLLTDNASIYNKIHKDVKNKYTKRDTTDYIKKYKKILLQEIESVVDLKTARDETLLKIEEKNGLKKYSILDKKLYIISGAYNVYGKELYDLYTKLIRSVYDNQKFESKIKFTEKQKIILGCTEQSYHFSKNNSKYRPKSFLDPKHNTIYDYMEDLSDINKSVWCNREKNIFRKKVVIISYRGTGVETAKNNFTFSGNYKRDYLLDLKIAQGKLRRSNAMKKIIKNFDKIYKKFGFEYDFYLSGHSLGGRLAFEIHRARTEKVKECHIFNAGFGIDIAYLNDIIKSKKRDYDWEKNLYNYHVGGKSIEPTDDDFISLLSGGYGNSSTFYKNFNKGLKGHGIINFYK